MTKICHPELRERAEALSENHAFRGAVFRESSKTVSGSGQCWIPARNVGQIPKQVRNDNMDCSWSGRSGLKHVSLNSCSGSVGDAAQRSAQPSHSNFSSSSRTGPIVEPAQPAPPPPVIIFTLLRFFIFLSFLAYRHCLIMIPAFLARLAENELRASRTPLSARSR